MIFYPHVLGQQIVLLLSILLALTLATAYLWRRGRLSSLRALAVPLALSVVFGTLDGLVTLGGTSFSPWLEGNYTLRAVLQWGGWLALCLWSVLWVFAWALVLDGLESLRLRLAGSGARVLLRGAQLYLFYALAMLHLSDVNSWIGWPALLNQITIQFLGWLANHAPGLLTISPIGDYLYVGLFFGALGTILHVGGAAAARKLRELAGQEPRPSPL
jgi:hypothetical protein